MTVVDIQTPEKKTTIALSYLQNKKTIYFFTKQNKLYVYESPKSRTHCIFWRLLVGCQNF